MSGASLRDLASAASVPLAAAVLEELARLEEPHVFDLGAPIEEAMPQWPEAGSRRLSRSWVVAPGERRGGGDVTFAVESIEASLHTSTHIDAVVHVQVDGLVHGGEPVATAAGAGFFERGGVESIPPIVAPFVLLDVARLAGVEALPSDAEVGADELERALRRDGLAIEPGTVVLVRTGTMRAFASGDAYLAAQPGFAPDGAEWLAERRILALGSDTAGTDPIPGAGRAAPVHKLLLFERGIHLVENLVLEQLAGSRRSRGVFVCLPLKLVGATGSWVRPVAIA